MRSYTVENVLLSFGEVRARRGDWIYELVNERINVYASRNILNERNVNIMRQTGIVSLDLDSNAT